jgi:hypothetical protein
MVVQVAEESTEFEDGVFLSRRIDEKVVFVQRHWPNWFSDGLEFLGRVSIAVDFEGKGDSERKK